MKAWEVIISLIIAFIVVIALILGAAPIKKLANSILGFGDGKNGDDKKKDNVQSSRHDIFDVVVNELTQCIENKDHECYCSVSNTFMPAGSVIEFKNIAGSLYVDFYRDVDISSCSIDINYKHIAEKIFKNNLFLFENSIGLPDLDRSIDGVYTIQTSDFMTGDRAYWTGSEFCSSKDVVSRNKIDFSNGILYKSYDRILFTRMQDRLRPCGVNIPARSMTTPDPIPNSRKSPQPALGNLL